MSLPFTQLSLHVLQFPWAFDLFWDGVRRCILLTFVVAWLSGSGSALSRCLDTLAYAFALCWSHRS